MKHVIGLERHNLHELQRVEQLACTLGREQFLSLVLELARAYPIDVEECRQSIMRQPHPSVIGMTDQPFSVMQQLSELLVQREPTLQKNLSYRTRDNHFTPIPHGLWLQIVARG